MGYVSGKSSFLGVNIRCELDSDHINGVSAITLKGHASSRGYVRLTGSHPQDVLDIPKLHFQLVDSPDIQKDLVALRKGIRSARQVVQLPHIAEHILQEVNEYIFEYLSTYLVSLVLTLLFLTDLK
jgi:hypothetical protein